MDTELKQLLFRTIYPRQQQLQRKEWSRKYKRWIWQRTPRVKKITLKQLQVRYPNPTPVWKQRLIRMIPKGYKSQEPCFSDTLNSIFRGFFK